MNRMIRQLRRLALEESNVLRYYVQAGRRVPRTRPLAKPWHDHFINVDGRIERDELLPDALEHPWARKDQT